MHYTYITSPETLQELCQGLESVPWVALDTEFMREKTYYPQLCLLQLATPDWAACVDPLADLDLAPLYEQLYRADLTKVFHAAGQDLEILYHLHGRLPAPLFDTQLAAPVLGYADQIGYGNLVAEVLGEQLEKAHSRADWSRRPLSKEQLRYAADDVIYLARLYPVLLERLGKQGRLAWLAEDFEALADAGRYASPPELAWQRVKGAERYKGAQLSVLQALAAWRETTAQGRDLPRGWLLKDDAMLDIARHQPKNLDALGRIRGMQERFVKSHGTALLDLIESARQRKPEPDTRTQRPERLSAAEEAVADLLMAVVRLRGMEHSLHPSVLASRKDLARLIQGDEGAPLLQGWRRALIGAELRAILNGGRVLSVDQGMVRIREQD
ncbi:MAG: ribonuclease D [Gammaproteobacteria bacterium]